MNGGDGRLAWLIALMVACAGCAVTIHGDARGQFWGFDSCDVREFGQAWCDARNRRGRLEL